MSPAYRGTISMVPQFQKDGVSLYRGDALAVLSVLSDNSVDAILTDPPYSKGPAKLDNVVYALAWGMLAHRPRRCAAHGVHGLAAASGIE